MSSFTVDVTHAIAGLVRELPPTRVEGAPYVWPREEREAWLKAFEAVLDMTYPAPAAPGDLDEKAS